MLREPPVPRVQVGLAEGSALSELLLSLAGLQRLGRLQLPLEPAQRLVLERPPSGSNCRRSDCFLRCDLR